MNSVEFVKDVTVWVRSIKALLQIDGKIDATLIIEDYNTVASMFAIAGCLDGDKLLAWMLLPKLDASPKLKHIELTWQYIDIYGEQQSGAKQLLADNKRYLAKAFDVAKCFLVLPNDIDWIAIRPALIKKQQKLEKKLTQATNKLNNPQFLANATQVVIDETTEQTKLLPEELNNINEMLNLM